MKGMPVPWDANGDLHSEKRYKEMLVRVRNYDSGLFCIETSLSGKRHPGHFEQEFRVAVYSKNVVE